jgi:hypothetical protein
MSKRSYRNVDCNPVVKSWFSIYFIICPLGCIVSAFISRKAKHNYDIVNYSIETWYRKYQIYTNKESKINNPLIALDVVNLLWAVVGVIVDNTFDDGKFGAIHDCLRDYGMNTVLFVYVFITISFIQAIRLGFYIIFLIHHRTFLGWWEARTRRDIQRMNRVQNEVRVNFKIIKYQYVH